MHYSPCYYYIKCAIINRGIFVNRHFKSYALGGMIMFWHKKEKDTINNDLVLLMEAMDGVITGNYEPIDTSGFTDAAVGDKMNQLKIGRAHV